MSKYMLLQLVLLLGFPAASFAVDPRFNITSAAEASQKSGDVPKGFFLRGDSRPPNVIFAAGFTPQGDDPDLRRHLSFAGNSAYVSLTRSSGNARRYAFGRASDGLATGYVYLVAASAFDNTYGVGVPFPDGHYVPTLFSGDPAVRANNEFAVSGTVQPSFIAGAYQYVKQRTGSGITLVEVGFTKNPAYEGPSYGQIAQYCRTISSAFCNMFCGGGGGSGSGTGCISAR